MAIIGITVGYSDVDEKNLGIHNDYISVIKQAGGIPLLLPPHLKKDQLSHLKSKIDGIMLPGGTDVHPEFYGETPKNTLRRVDPARDKLELSLTAWALKDKIPILALCRGIQVLNIACGGSIYQELETEMQHEQNAPRRFPSHSVAFVENSIFQKIYDCQKLPVNSFHHQSINNTGKNIKIEGKAKDGTIEAVSVKNHPFAAGVQWHPERMYQSSPIQVNLFEMFIKKC